MIFQFWCHFSYCEISVLGIFQFWWHFSFELDPPFGPVYLDLYVWPNFLDPSIWTRLLRPVYLDQSIKTRLFQPIFLDPLFGPVYLNHTFIYFLLFLLDLLFLLFLCSCWPFINFVSSLIYFLLDFSLLLDFLFFLGFVSFLILASFLICVSLILASFLICVLFYSFFLILYFCLLLDFCLLLYFCLIDFCLLWPHKKRFIFRSSRNIEKFYTQRTVEDITNTFSTIYNNIVKKKAVIAGIEYLRAKQIKGQKGLKIKYTNLELQDYLNPCSNITLEDQRIMLRLRSEINPLKRSSEETVK